MKGWDELKGRLRWTLLLHEHDLCQRLWPGLILSAQGQCYNMSAKGSPGPTEAQCHTLCFGERPKFVKSLLWLLLQICLNSMGKMKLTVRLNLLLLVITAYNVIIFGLYPICDSPKKLIGKVANFILLFLNSKYVNGVLETTFCIHITFGLAGRWQKWSKLA